MIQPLVPFKASRKLGYGRTRGSGAELPQEENTFQLVSKRSTRNEGVAGWENICVPSRGSLCQSSFHFYDQMPGKISLKEEHYFGLSFEGLQGPVTLGLWRRTLL